MSNILTQFALTAEQRTEAMSHNDGGGVNPRAVDGTMPGSVLDINPSSASYGQLVELAGKYVTPKSVIDNPIYAGNTVLLSYLSDKPFGLMNDDDIYAPIVGDP